MEEPRKQEALSEDESLEENPTESRELKQAVFNSPKPLRSIGVCQEEMRSCRIQTDEPYEDPEKIVMMIDRKVNLAKARILEETGATLNHMLL